MQRRRQRAPQGAHNNLRKRHTYQRPRQRHPVLIQKPQPHRGQRRLRHKAKVNIPQGVLQPRAQHKKAKGHALAQSIHSVVLQFAAQQRNQIQPPCRQNQRVGLLPLQGAPDFTKKFPHLQNSDKNGRRFPAKPPWYLWRTGPAQTAAGSGAPYSPTRKTHCK